MFDSTEAPVLRRLFTDARTHSAWTGEPVAEDLARRLYDLVRLGPTSANVSPARFVFLASPEAKARLEPHLHAGNRAKTLAAPVCVIVAYDEAFASKLEKLFPHAPGAAAWFSDPQVAYETALRNSSLQGGYLILAARALGLDCGPMSGFDPAGVDREFFSGSSWRTNFLCNLGHGDGAALRERLPRLDFEEACLWL